MKNYSIITAYMYWLSNNISNNYLHHIVSSHLDEAYKPLTLNPSIIKNSLLSILYPKTNELNTISNEELLDMLNKEFIKANIIFIPFLESSISNKIKPKYERSGLVYAETDKQIEVYVNDTFFNLLRNCEINESNENINALAKDIYSLYSHESTHSNQKEVEKVKQSGIDINKINSKLEKHRYLANIREIAAHARELANQLLLTDKSVKEIQELLTTRKGNELLCKNYPLYKDYYDAFGIALTVPKKYRETDKDIQWRIRVFNRFRKYLVYFLLLDLRFIYHEDLEDKI